MNEEYQAIVNLTSLVQWNFGLSEEDRMKTIRIISKHLQVCKNIIQSSAMSRVNPNWTPSPHAAHILITFGCNLKCKCCPSWTVKDHSELSTEEWLNTFRQLRSLDIVKILGGEPLVRKDIVRLLVGVREIIDPFMLQLASNGMLTERLVEVLHAIAWPGLQLRISVDGTEQTHDAMRGTPGSWKRVTETIRQASALRERYGFTMGINFAVTDESIGELEEMIEFAAHYGADLIPGVNLDPFLLGIIPPEEGGIQKVIMISDKQAALKILQDSRVGLRSQIPSMAQRLSRFLVSDTFERQLNNEQYTFTCRELRDLIYILPNGDVVRCGMDHKPVGNVSEQSIKDIWKSPVVKSCRKKVDSCPGCYQASIQIMSRLYGGNILAN
jgi:MoaA/NifB/PqqE/SkfB family radical SAM enzyme